MCNWSNILNEVNASANPALVLQNKRAEFFAKITSITGRNVITYYSGWLKNNEAPNTSINEQDKNAFMEVVHNLDRSKGLDIILHTPGGDIAVTESIVDYLKTMFHKDIRAIIPQISMSAGTMIALSCKSIIMGEQSALGPIDPQMGGIACQAVLDEFKDAVEQIKQEPSSLGLWQTIISRYTPTFLISCQNAVKWSEELAEKWIHDINPSADFDNIKNVFLNHKHSYSHSRRISKQECKDVGLHIEDLETNQSLQDSVLGLHHCYMIFLDKFNVSKIVENQLSGCYMQQYSAK